MLLLFAHTSLPVWSGCGFTEKSKKKIPTQCLYMASVRGYCLLNQQYAWKSMFLFGISSLLNNMARCSNPSSTQIQRQLFKLVLSAHCRKLKRGSGPKRIHTHYRPPQRATLCHMIFILIKDLKSEVTMEKIFNDS